ncbi:MAG: hypothetical protein EKK48_15130 [Candidatus Melainabacteria bacterium]|nr:MAG: hypothetical protein EKK48_15130 [Candidatus Melainabacteria bacterium]
MTDWLDIFDQVIYNEVMFSTSSETAPARQEKSSPLFNQAIMDLFASSANDTAVPDFLTTIVKQDEWWIATKPDGSLNPIKAEAGEFRKMMEIDQPPSPKRKRQKSARTGSGGILLPVYDEPPSDKITHKVTGCELAAQTTSKDLDGLLVYSKDQTEFEIDASNFDLMRDIASETDLERWLTTPSPGQVEKLLQSTWYAEFHHSDNINISTRDRLALIHTRPDRLGLSFNKRVPMTGEKLFRTLVEQKVGGALVEISRIGLKHYETSTIILSPAFFYKLLEGEDIRPGAKPMPAQSMDEIKLWLDFSKFPYNNRRFLETTLNGEKLVRVVAPDSSEWQALETIRLEFKKPAPTLSPVFSLPAQENFVDSGFGPHPSRLLCPGLLAAELGAMAFQVGKYPEKLWQPGRWVLLGRLLNQDDIEDSKKRLRLARELQKLIPPGSDSIPLSAILTNKGMNVFHEHPIAFTKAWIDATVAQAEKYTKSFVWN